MILYNENNPYASKWLRALSEAGHIAHGKVDDRSISKITSGDIAADVTQFHAFAGIGAWSFALRLAGWPDDVPVWTGSCPCTPFSVSGQRKGAADARHLWPAWFALISKCRPPVIFGEQVVSPLGRLWFDAVSADLETLGYAVGASDLCAASVGAPHIRQRLFFVARLGDSKRERISHEGSGRADSSQAEMQEAGQRQWLWPDIGQPDNALPDFWEDCEWIDCSDGKRRPFKPGVRPLADGPSRRVGRVRGDRAGRMRGYGNAIVPQVAAVFIRAFLESM